MGARSRGGRVVWGGLCALGAGTWLVGCVAFGLVTSHSGLASAADWMVNGGMYVGGAALAFASAAMFTRSGADDRDAARAAAVVWGVLALLGALVAVSALFATAWNSAISPTPGPEAVFTGLALATAAVPVLGFAAAVARARRARPAGVRPAR